MAPDRTVSGLISCELKALHNSGLATGLLFSFHLFSIPHKKAKLLCSSWSPSAWLLLPTNLPPGSSYSYFYTQSQCPLALCSPC